MPLQKMTESERRSVFSLSIIMALRMLGLFMVLPLFALYAAELPGATPALIGLAMGIYGLTQALLQIPFGTLSDHIGRKKIILLGLCIFMLGSIIAAASHTIWGMVIGRALQGCGAIGSTIIALIADLTRVEQRTKAMAISGMTIGFSFALAMITGPILATWINISGIFWLAAGLSLLAIFVLFVFVPMPPPIIQPSVMESRLQRFVELCSHPELLRLNLGIFLLHALFTASFVMIPIALQTMGDLRGSEQWLLYLPILLLAFLISIPCIMIAEKKQWVKRFFVGGILCLVISECILWFFINNLLLSALSLLLFFSAFSLLEAFLPSLVSKTAPPSRKGAALGIYSFSQFFGIFIGGVLGGWVYGTFGLVQVNLLCMILAVIWLAIAFKMKNPQYSTTSYS